MQKTIFENDGLYNCITVLLVLERTLLVSGVTKGAVLAFLFVPIQEGFVGASATGNHKRQRGFASREAVHFIFHDNLFKGG
jgi:uncharacterized membrane protein